jgi:hypothetical protein
MRGRRSGVALALAALVLGGSAAADAKAPAKKKPTSVVNVFRVEYEATVTWNHHEAEGTMTGEQALSYTVRGTLPDVTFECAKACEIEALIGVFGGTRKHPKVTPIRSRKMRLKANTATTVSLPVNAKARAAAKQGRLVMTLKAKGGKRQIYPLI